MNRLLPLFLAFVLSGFFVWMMRGDKTEYGLFQFLAGKTPPTSAAVQEPLLDKDVPMMAALNGEMTQLVERTTPSVVSITTSKTVRVRRYVPNFFGYERRDERYNQNGLGSGMIVSTDGYILTNYHVIAGVDDIQVMTHDRRQFPATVVGQDMDIDLAVLKIEDKEHGFPALPFGDSDKVKVGEMVLSIGNPFGLSESVTRGIISARERRLSDSAFDLLQTDAVINPGNSGGPLVNIHGEIIGIAMAIFQGQEDVKVWQGVGLAIPSNDAKATYTAIVNKTKPSFGWIGIGMEETINPATGQPEKGIVVTDVTPDSPASQADIQAGDRVMKFGGRDLNHSHELRSMVQNGKIGEKAKLTIQRGGETITREPVIIEKPRLLDGNPEADPNAPLVQAKTRSLEQMLGINIRALLPGERRYAGLNTPYGLLVYEVSETGAAHGILNPGDIILTLDEQPIEDTDHLDEMMAKLPKDKEAILGVVRNGRLFPLRLMPTADNT